MDLYQELCGILGEENVFTKEPMSRHTTFRAGGPADFFFSIFIIFIKMLSIMSLYFV